MGNYSRFNLNFILHLLETSVSPETTLYATDWGADEYQLSLGDPYEDMPDMTWRYLLAKRYDCHSFEEYYGTEDPQKLPNWSLDYLAPEHGVLEYWVREESADARAYNFLDSCNFAPDPGGSDSVGEIHFVDSPCPCNNSRLVAVPDDISLSLPQNKRTPWKTRRQIWKRTRATLGLR